MVVFNCLLDAVTMAAYLVLILPAAVTGDSTLLFFAFVAEASEGRFPAAGCGVVSFGDVAPWPELVVEEAFGTSSG